MIFGSMIPALEYSLSICVVGSDEAVSTFAVKLIDVQLTFLRLIKC